MVSTAVNAKNSVVDKAVDIKNNPKEYLVGARDGIVTTAKGVKNGVVDSAKAVKEHPLESLGNLGKTAIGIQGFIDRGEAKDVKAAAELLFEKAQNKYKDHEESLKQEINAFAVLRARSLSENIKCFLDLLKRLELKNKEKSYELLDDIEIPKAELNYLADIGVKASEALTTAIGAVAVGTTATMATPAVVTNLVMSYATASTGTAISSLHGAAATNAALAWLGGGSIASGGSGMAGGAAVLQGITVGATAGIAVLAAGTCWSMINAKKLTEAKEFEKEVAIKVAEMEAAEAFMTGVSTRTQELSSVTEEIMTRSNESLKKLQAIADIFDANNESHAKIFQENGLLIKTIGELAKTPLFDPDSGKLSDSSAAIVVKTHNVLNTEL